MYKIQQNSTIILVQFKSRHKSIVSWKVGIKKINLWHNNKVYKKKVGPKVITRYKTTEHMRRDEVDN